MQAPLKQEATGKEHLSRPRQRTCSTETKAERRLYEITAQAMDGFEKWVRIFKAEITSQR